MSRDKNPSVTEDQTLTDKTITKTVRSKRVKDVTTPTENPIQTVNQTRTDKAGTRMDNAKRVKGTTVKTENRTQIRRAIITESLIIRTEAAGTKGEGINARTLPQSMIR